MPNLTLADLKSRSVPVAAKKWAKKKAGGSGKKPVPTVGAAAPVEGDAAPRKGMAALYKKREGK